MTKLEVFCNLGYRRDPFVGNAFRTGDSVRVERILTMAVESRAMVSIVGERGIGKSDAINAALDKLGVRRVTVLRAQKEKLTIADIETAIILDLSDESPKRGGETRSRQLRRIVGEASRREKKGIVVGIEEAQRLHAATLKSLKTLREIEWMGERELFTVVLIGQSDPMNRAGVSEVKLRSDLVRMQGLSADEAAGYVRATIGKHFEEQAVDAVAELPQARNYLELQALCIELLNRTLADGREQVSEADVQAVAGSQTAAPLPKAPKRAQAVTVTGGDALKSVLSRRSLSGAEEKEAVHA
jgi:type II secretory pathway predicted ATPase ExeA